jgi:hypothetical protein
MVRRLILLAAMGMLLTGLLAAPAVAEDTYRSKTLDGVVSVNQPQNLSGSAYLQITRQAPSLAGLIDNSMLKNPTPNSTQAVGGAAAALIPYRSPAAKFSRNILVSRDYGHVTYQTEPSLAVNPKDPNHVIIGMIDYNFPGVVTYTSFDGGVVWQGPFQPKIPRNMFSGAGDPVVVFGKDGAAYICQMAINQEKFTVSGVEGYAEVASIVTNKSTDGGLTWGDSFVAAPGEVFSEDVEVPQGERPRGYVYSFFVDKPWMTIGPSAAGGNAEVIYLTYTLFVEVYSLS